MAVKRPLPSNKVPQSYSQDQNSPLHYACFRGDYDEVLMLLLRGEDVHALNIWRETPLHQVAYVNGTLIGLIRGVYTVY